MVSFYYSNELIACMSLNNRDCSILLSNGRRLGYADFGLSSGEPVIFFHGWPGTRLDVWCCRSIASQVGIRMIAVDRPGMGFSDFQPERKVTDFPKDVIELMNHLAIDRFKVLGFSTGGLYAIESAIQFPKRISAVGLVSAVPYFEIEFQKKDLSLESKLLYSVGNKPLLLKFLSKILVTVTLRQVKKHPEKEYQRSLKNLPEIDQEMWAQPAIQRWFFEEYLPDLFRQDTKGIHWDFLLLVRWLANPHPHVAPEALRAPFILWHGEKDSVVPFTVSTQQARILPNSQLTLFPREGHKIVYTRFETILKTLTTEEQNNE